MEKRKEMLCETYHGHTIAMVDILVQLPRCTEEGADGRYGTPIPANGQLASFPLKPQHEFLGGGRSRIALRVAKDEIEADVTCGTRLIKWMNTAKVV